MKWRRGMITKALTLIGLAAIIYSLVVTIHAQADYDGEYDGDDEW
jgi:hypothetical protein